MTTAACKRPRVLVDLHGDQRWQADCYVPGCTWAYGNVVKTDVEEQAARHRREHRNAVPRTWIERDPEFDVYCDPCGGHRRTFARRVDAEAWLQEHLTTEHRLVVCS